MSQFSRYNIFLVMSGVQLLGFLGFGYLVYTKIPHNNGAWIIEGLLLFAIILNLVFYFYFKKVYRKIK
ncbi:hypothetical protein BN1058_02273 [Paraliobacillus sp. PM-2]|uniref:hypothetical protein n=1 Tax=Paraliobacillus sp. PM-2 TaxID=1462524 RepID=UPI00061BE436|nr:hypothetical protein [Paraliobacillus sp. PM-2]CQR47939.1 hypothetical protein BN1058_02273 [Paraliobacillus sp. PM-2]